MCVRKSVYLVCTPQLHHLFLHQWILGSSSCYMTFVNNIAVNMIIYISELMVLLPLVLHPELYCYIQWYVLWFFCHKSFVTFWGASILLYTWQWLFWFSVPLIVPQDSIFSTASLYIYLFFFMAAILKGMGWCIIVVCIFLITSVY